MINKIAALSINHDWYGDDRINWLKNAKWDEAKKWLKEQEEKGNAAFTCFVASLNNYKPSSTISNWNGDDLIIWLIEE